jgi:hypothetical protein
MWDRNCLFSHETVEQLMDLLFPLKFVNQALEEVSKLLYKLILYDVVNHNKVSVLVIGLCILLRVYQ